VHHDRGTARTSHFYGSNSAKNEEGAATIRSAGKNHPLQCQNAASLRSSPTHDQRAHTAIVLAAIARGRCLHGAARHRSRMRLPILNLSRRRSCSTTCEVIIATEASASPCGRRCRGAWPKGGQARPFVTVDFLPGTVAVRRCGARKPWPILAFSVCGGPGIPLAL
jgi:hypothetical protein